MCIGRRFAETEAMVLICAIVGRYKVELPESVRLELSSAGELNDQPEVPWLTYFVGLGGTDGHGRGLTGEQQRLRRNMVVKKTHQGLTLKPLDVPLVFRRRV